MTLPTYNTAFTDNVSTISADFLNNYVRTQIPKAIDGVGGSNGSPYTPSTVIDIQGQGIQFVVKNTYTAVFESGATLDLKSGAVADLESGSTFTNASTQTRSGSETLSGVGATTAWRTGSTADSDATYDVTYDELRVPDALGANRVYTLRSSTSPTPSTGNRIRFSRTGSLLTSKATFKREDATTLASIDAGLPGWVEFCYISAAWHAVAWGGNVTISAVV